MRLHLFVLFLFLTFQGFSQENNVPVSKENYKKTAQSSQSAISEILVDFKTENLSAQPNYKQLELCAQKITLLDLLEKKAKALIALNQRGIALQTLSTADRLVDIMRKGHAENGVKSFWKTKTHNLYETTLDLTFSDKNAKKAFYFFEKNKIALLSDKLLDNQTSTLPKDLSKREILLIKTLKFARKAASIDKTKHPDFLKARADFEDFQAELADNYPHYYTLRYDNTVPILKENGDVYAYQNEEQYVHFFHGKNHIYLLRFGANKTKMHRIPNTAQTINLIEKYLEKFRAQASHLNPSSDYSDLSFRVYELILKPLFPDGKLPNDLFLLTEGLFNLVPFEILKTKPNSKTNADYLSEQTNVRKAYSVKELKNQQGIDSKEDVLKNKTNSTEKDLSDTKIKQEALVHQNHKMLRTVMYGAIGLLAILLILLIRRRKNIF